MSRASRRIPPLVFALLVLTACGGSRGTAAAPTPTAAIIIVGSPTPGASTTVGAPVTGAASAPGAASATSAISAATTSAAATTAVTVSGTGRSGLRLRQSPNGKELQVLPDGSVLSVLGDAQQQAGGYSWLHVRTAKGVEGWVATQYLSPSPAGSGSGGATATATPA